VTGAGTRALAVDMAGHACAPPPGGCRWPALRRRPAGARALPVACHFTPVKNSYLTVTRGQPAVGPTGANKSTAGEEVTVVCVDITCDLMDGGRDRSRVGLPRWRMRPGGEHDLPNCSQYGDSSHPQSRMRAVRGASDLALHLWAILGSNQWPPRC